MTDTAEKSTEIRDAVRATIEGYASLRKDGDIDGIVATFTEQGCVMPPSAPAAVGPEALRTAYEPFRTALGLECHYQFDEMLVSGDLASARTRSHGTVLNRETGTVTPAAWRELFVLQCVEDTWLIAHYMFQAINS